MYKCPSNNSILYKSPLGKIKLTENQGYLIRVEFVERKLKSEFCQENNKNPDNRFLKKVCLELDKYFSGNLRNFNLPIRMDGTDFQRTAWKALLSIPYGETVSYLQQAIAIDNPNAKRAVGQANSKNPIPIIIPCHRVIGRNGNLIGYSGGIDLKARLLELEQYFKNE